MAIPQYDAAGDLLAWKLEHTAQEVDDTIDGLEDKADQTSLEAEQTARQQADQTLHGNIEAEATARTAAYNELKSDLQEEQTARRAADESVRSDIVNPDWNATSGRAKILNKPNTLAGYGISDAYTSLQGLDSSVATKFLTIRVATIVDQINVERHTVSLTNTDKYPFNNSAVTVALDERRNNLDYSVEAEVLSKTGGVESVEIYDKQLNGFKVKFNGSGSAATVRLKITGGIT